MKTHSVIFIENPKYERLDVRSPEPNSLTRLSSHFRVNLFDVVRRVGSSFLPPVCGDASRRVYVDFVGPAIALLLLGCVLHYGHANKHPTAALPLPPFTLLFYYSATMPSVCLLFSWLGSSRVGLPEVISLIGYGLYGHFFTLLLSLMLGSSDFVFFFCMTLFGGLSGLRIVLVLLMTIPRPGARLIICSLVCVLNLLFLIFIHFGYMHTTFMYGNKLEPNEFSHA